MAREGSAEYSFPTEASFLLFLSAIGLIVCDCHDKRLRFSRFLVRLFFTIFVIVLFFRSFSSKWPSFCISEKYLPVNRNFKNLNFRNISTLLRSTFLLLRPLVVFFCPAGRLRFHLAEWHILPGQVPINVPIDRITPGYRRVVLQFSITNLTNRIRKKNFPLHPNSLRVTNCIVLHLTAFQHFHKICTMRSVLDKISSLTIYVTCNKTSFALAD